MHSSLAETADGLPFGQSAIKCWTRKRFKGTAALKKKVNPTRIAIEKKESIRAAFPHPSNNRRQLLALSIRPLPPGSYAAKPGMSGFPVQQAATKVRFYGHAGPPGRWRNGIREDRLPNSQRPRHPGQDCLCRA
jgi:hypothetical protein